MQAFELLLDLIMLFDIMTEFITTKEKDGRKINQIRELTFEYIKTTFIFDIMACLPGLITLEMDPSWYLFKLFRYLQMPRFFDQLEMIVRKLKSVYVTQSTMITNMYLGFSTLFIMLILFHTLASAWIYIGKEEGHWRD